MDAGLWRAAALNGAATGLAGHSPAVRWLPLGPLAVRRACYGLVMVCLGVTV